MSNTCLQFDSMDGITLLQRIGIGVQCLQRALRVGDGAARACSGFAPPTHAGVERWGKTVEELRFQLSGLGWRIDDTRNFPRAVSPDGRIEIAVSSGTEATGVPDRMPRTKNAKGVAMSEAVTRHEQFDLFPQNCIQLREARPVRVQTWVLLYYADERENIIRCELSLPSASDELGHVCEWAPRIILPVLDLDMVMPEREKILAEDDQPIVVEITRRKKD